MSDTVELAQSLGAALGDQYVVESPLGEGGFAVVFLVRDLTLKRRLAVKVLSPDMIASRTVLDRFRREAETVAQLSHPNIVPLHFIGQRDDLLYLAMPCIDGGSLADRIEREGPLPLDDAARITGEVAAALGHAHRHGVVHRDIKPGNVLMDAETGRCLVTDFGIARSADAVHLTATGMTVGTPAYLSPEQVSGESSDHRVDLYALGVMAYEMVAGRLPFEGPTPTAAMMKRLAGPPVPVRELRREVPDNLASAIDGCLATAPDDRFQSADDVIRVLGGGLPKTGERVSRAASTRARRVAASIIAVLALAAVVLWRAQGASTATEPGDAATPVTPVDTHLALIPAGNYFIGTDTGPAIARPRHSVRIDAVHIEKTEVTVADYARFAAATSAPLPWSGEPPAGNLPVTRVAWGDAANYCAWKYPNAGRLPTEFEWEAAARGLEGRTYPYGSAAEVARANTETARRGRAAPVGSFPRSASPEGIHDLSGNVWEWTATSLRAYPGGREIADSMSAYRVIRGGAFDTADSLATGWMRGYFRASARADDLPKIGFRCARSPVERGFD